MAEALKPEEYERLRQEKEQQQHEEQECSKQTTETFEFRRKKRKVRTKKLQQILKDIQSLKKRKIRGDRLADNQLTKINNEDQILNEINELLQQQRRDERELKQQKRPGQHREQHSEECKKKMSKINKKLDSIEKSKEQRNDGKSPQNPNEEIKINREMEYEIELIDLEEKQLKYTAHTTKTNESNEERQEKIIEIKKRLIEIENLKEIRNQGIVLDPRKECEIDKEQAYQIKLNELEKQQQISNMQATGTNVQKIFNIKNKLYEIKKLNEKRDRGVLLDPSQEIEIDKEMEYQIELGKLQRQQQKNNAQATVTEVNVQKIFAIKTNLSETKDHGQLEPNQEVEIDEELEGQQQKGNAQVTEIQAQNTCDIMIYLGRDVKLREMRNEGILVYPEEEEVYQTEPVELEEQHQQDNPQTDEQKILEFQKKLDEIYRLKEMKNQGIVIDSDQEDEMDNELEYQIELDELQNPEMCESRKQVQSEIKRKLKQLKILKARKRHGIQLQPNQMTEITTEVEHLLDLEDMEVRQANEELRLLVEQVQLRLPMGNEELGTLEKTKELESPEELEELESPEEPEELEPLVKQAESRPLMEHRELGGREKPLKPEPPIRHVQQQLPIKNKELGSPEKLGVQVKHEVLQPPMEENASRLPVKPEESEKLIPVEQKELEPLAEQEEQWTTVEQKELCTVEHKELWPPVGQEELPPALEQEKLLTPVEQKKLISPKEQKDKRRPVKRKEAFTQVEQGELLAAVGKKELWTPIQHEELRAQLEQEKVTASVDQDEQYTEKRKLKKTAQEWFFSKIIKACRQLGNLYQLKRQAEEGLALTTDQLNLLNKAKEFQRMILAFSRMDDEENGVTEEDDEMLKDFTELVEQESQEKLKRQEDENNELLHLEEKASRLNKVLEIKRRQREREIQQQQEEHEVKRQQTYKAIDNLREEEIETERLFEDEERRQGLSAREMLLRLKDEKTERRVQKEQKIQQLQQEKEKLERKFQREERKLKQIEEAENQILLKEEEKVKQLEGDIERKKYRKRRQEEEIKRLQNEDNEKIKRLEEGVKQKQEEIKRLRREIEQMKRQVDEYRILAEEEIKIFQKEEIREFLKEKKQQFKQLGEGQKIRKLEVVEGLKRIEEQQKQLQEEKENFIRKDEHDRIMNQLIGEDLDACLDKKEDESNKEVEKTDLQNFMFDALRKKYLLVKLAEQKKQQELDIKHLENEDEDEVNILLD